MQRRQEKRFDRNEGIEEYQAVADGAAHRRTIQSIRSDPIRSMLSIIVPMFCFVLFTRMDGSCVSGMERRESVFLHQDKSTVCRFVVRGDPQRSVIDDGDSEAQSESVVHFFFLCQRLHSAVGGASSLQKTGPVAPEMCLAVYASNQMQKQKQK
jgi:hypothetical protein